MNLSELPKAALVQRIGDLQQLLDDLRQSMSMAGSLPTEWKLTPKERALFLALIRNDIVTKDMAKLILYGTMQRRSHSVDVFMSRIRRKTEDHSVTIETINRTGYRLVDRLVWAKTLKLDAVEQH